jgi:hypothetical protein
MAATTEERLVAIKHIVKLFEVELKDIISVDDRFDITRLPSIIQDVIKLATAKSPAFSNISACTTGNTVFMHLLAQLRPKINDITYSNDILGINYLGINIAGSGSGKDSTYSTISKACDTAFKLITQERKDQEEKRARSIALREKRKDDPNAVDADLTYSDYFDFIRPLPTTIAEASSTRGGIVSNLTEHQSREYGALLVIMNEFGLALKTNSTVSEILELLGTLYDQGNASTQMFKTVEVREQAIESTYPNALLHSSPRIIFGDERVRNNISMIFSTMLGRRTWFSMPEEDEATENTPIPSTLEELITIANERRATISTLSSKLDNITAEIVRNLLASEESRIVSFDEEAATLYTMYFEYCAKRAELMEDTSILQIEMNGRTFKLGRLAALWSLISGSNIISLGIMKSAIYFAEYNSKYLETFIKKTSSKYYELLGEVFKKGKIKKMDLDVALSNGYITRVSKDFTELLEPLNSYLRNSGVASYNSDTRTFEYTPFKKVEDTGEYAISYTNVEGVPKHNRTVYLGNFENYRTGSMLLLKTVVSRDTIYNMFKFVDEDIDGKITKMKRNQKSLIGTTKVLSIDVDESTIDIEVMHRYLSEYKHIITTTSDYENKHKFRIILPVDTEISGEDPQRFKCIVRTICEELSIKADPTSFIPAQPMYGYTGAEVFSQEEGILYRVSEIIAECAVIKEEGIRPTEKPKTSTARKKAVEEIMTNATKVFDYVINCPRGSGSLSMARASLHMVDVGFNQEQYLQVMNYLNSSWQAPMESQRFEKLTNQFIHKMEN